MQVLEGWRFSGVLLRREKRLRWDFLRLGLLAVLLVVLKCGLAGGVLLLRQKEPAALLTSEAVLWRPVQMIASLGCSAVWYWCSWPVWMKCVRAAGMASGQRISRRRLLLLALETVWIRTIVLQGVPLCLFGAYRLAYAGTQHTESAPWLFGAVQLAVLSVLCLLGYIYVSLGLLCAPFVYAADPSYPLWRIPRAAMAVMYGGRKELLVMLACYGLMMLPVVTIPWVLPRAGTALAVFFSIRVREAEQEECLQRAGVAGVCSH